MMPRRNPPPDCDLTRSTQEIMQVYEVSRAVVYRWKREKGLVLRRGARGVRRVSLGLWGGLSDNDWKQGYSHVAWLMGVSPQAVHQMRTRLVKAGYDIAKPPRGRPPGS